MELRDNLEIILVTYNREKYLRNTLEQIFADNSPVKEVDFTILDNASTDGTSKLISEYSKKFPNIKHIKRPRNIGGNANIASAFSLVSKKYYWIICDDDEFDFSSWQEVEEALTKDYDIIMLNPSNIIGGEITLPRILNACSFLPLVIGKSENLTEGVLYETFDNISNWFPHFASVCAVINKKGNFYINSHDVVHSTQNEIRQGVPAHKKIKCLSKQAKHKFFHPCYLNSLYLIQDKKLRSEIIDDYFALPFVDKDFICFIEDVVKSPYNYFTPLSVMSFRQKVRFSALIIFVHILYFFGFRSYLWYQFEKTPKWQIKLIKIYKKIFKRK